MEVDQGKSLPPVEVVWTLFAEVERLCIAGNSGLTFELEYNSVRQTKRKEHLHPPLQPPVQ